MLVIIDVLLFFCDYLLVSWEKRFLWHILLILSSLNISRSGSNGTLDTKHF